MGISTKEFSTRLRRLARELRDLSDPLGDIVDETIVDIEERIDRGVDINGAPFKALSPKYAKQKARKFPGKPILKRTNAMVAGANIKTKISRKSARVEYTTPYAQFHQFGTDKMPERAFVGISDKVSREADNILGKHIERVLKATL